LNGANTQFRQLYATDAAWRPAQPAANQVIECMSRSEAYGGEADMVPETSNTSNGFANTMSSSGFADASSLDAKIAMQSNMSNGFANTMSSNGFANTMSSSGFRLHGGLPSLTQSTFMGPPSLLDTKSSGFHASSSVEKKMQGSLSAWHPLNLTTDPGSVNRQKDVRRGRPAPEHWKRTQLRPASLGLSRSNASGPVGIVLDPGSVPVPPRKLAPSMAYMDTNYPMKGGGYDFAAHIPLPAGLKDTMNLNLNLVQ